ncbi:MAG: hypothetical protein WC851_00750 [Candidatus Shapirobacteria bacterium]|jgi:hypothetical protein
MRIGETVAAAHGKIISEKLGHIYSLKPTLDYIRQHPREVEGMFVNYCSLFYRFLNLDSKELSVVQTVAEEMKDGPHKSAVVFRERIAGHEKQFVELIRTVADPGTPQYKEGIAQLSSMMTNAWDMKVDGLSPKDGDRRSDGVIWGYVRGSLTPELDAHFLIAHGTERVVTAALNGTPLHDLVQKKDWSFPVSTAIVGLDGVRGVGAGGYLFPIWQAPRPAGLGWISPGRVEAFQKAVAVLK